MVEMLTEDVAAAFEFGPEGSVTLELASSALCVSGAYVDASEPGAFVKPQTTSPSLSVTQGMGGASAQAQTLELQPLLKDPGAGWSI
jgi:hypothetical protein